MNRSIMLELIRRHHPISRADLARLTGVFRSSVSDIVDELVTEGLVIEKRDTTNHSRGRAPLSLRLNETRHFAAEVGHMVVEPSGPQCRCGRYGCWELYVSNYATWSRVHPRTPFDAPGFEQMLLEAQQGEARSRKAVLETANYLSLGISNIGYAFNPAEVVIAERITAVWDLIEPEILRACGSPHLHYAVRPARLSADDSLLHGAVCLALRETFAGPKFGQN